MLRRALFTLIACLALSLSAFAQEAPPDPACPGAPAPRLVVGGRGRVLPGQSNNVRDQAGLSGARIGQIPGDQEFAVLDGPACQDGYNWWRVDANGLEGWMVEGQGTAYWTRPAALDANVVPINNPYLTPEYPLANRLASGAEARLQSPDGAPLPLVAAPSTSAEAGASAEAGELADGTTVTLLEGSGGWWRVEAEGGVTGWLPEGVTTGGSGSFFPILAPLCPHTDDRVAFLTNDQQTEQNLYTIGGDARGLCNLTYGAQRGYEAFDWSPDGRALAFSAQSKADFSCQAYTCAAEPYTPAGLYTIGVDGRELRRLAEGVVITDVAWSPDGTQIAFLQEGENVDTRSLNVISAEGSGEARVLLPAETRLDHVRWSPDGAWIATVADINPPGDRDFFEAIVLVNVVSGDIVPLFRSDWRVESLDWSPDGRSIAASVYIETGRNVLAEIDVESGDYEVVYDAENFGAVYSPDGTQIALWRSEMLAPRWLERIDRATGEVTRLATLPGVNGRGVSWTPDGAHVLVGSSGVMRVDVATGELRSLFVGARGSIGYPPQAQPSG